MERQNIVVDGWALAVEKVNQWGKDFYLLLPNIIVGFVFLLLFIAAAWMIRQAVLTYFFRSNRRDLGRLIGDFVLWAVIVFGILIFLTIVVPSLTPVDILSSLGIGSLAAGFAFKDILQNWLSGLLILLRAPFRRGDQIRVKDVEGTVQAIEPRATIIRTYDGRDIIIPNTTIYIEMVLIQTSQPTRRIEIDFTVGYAYKIRHITDIIMEAISPIDEILKDPPPQILCSELGSTSLGVTLRWWIASARSNEVISRSRVIQAIKEAFEANDIDPTDPQLIYYQRQMRVPPSEMGNPKEDGNEPPPEVTVSAADPEASKPKLDDRKKTMLPDH